MVCEWFNVENRVKTEATILVPHILKSSPQLGINFDGDDELETNLMAKIYRPDRIIITPDKKVWVIDYKFGAEGSNNSSNHKYIKQLAKYVELIRNMGYRNVEGKIWYVYSNDIVNV